MELLPTAPDWENEQVIGLHKEPPRATALPFPDRTSALVRLDSVDAAKWAQHRTAPPFIGI